VCISFCVCIIVSACVFVLFPLFDLSFVASFSTLILLVGSFDLKNRLPYNLYCVGGDVKHCTIQSNPISNYNFAVKFCPSQSLGKPRVGTHRQIRITFIN